jgi:hypothetical protein
MEIVWVSGELSYTVPDQNRIDIATANFVDVPPQQGAAQIAQNLAHEAYHLFGPYARDGLSLCEEYMAYWTGDQVLKEFEEKGFASGLDHMNFTNTDPRVQSGLERFFEQTSLRFYLEKLRPGEMTAYPSHRCPP